MSLRKSLTTESIPVSSYRVRESYPNHSNIRETSWQSLWAMLTSLGSEVSLLEYTWCSCIQRATIADGTAVSPAALHPSAHPSAPPRLSVARAGACRPLDQAARSVLTDLAPEPTTTLPPPSPLSPLPVPPLPCRVPPLSQPGGERSWWAGHWAGQSWRALAVGGRSRWAVQIARRYAPGDRYPSRIAQ